MNNYKDTNGVWFELVTVKDINGNLIKRVYRECSTQRATELEQQPTTTA